MPKPTTISPTPFSTSAAPTRPSSHYQAGDWAQAGIRKGPLQSRPGAERTRQACRGRRVLSAGGRASSPAGPRRTGNSPPCCASSIGSTEAEACFRRANEADPSATDGLQEWAETPRPAWPQGRSAASAPASLQAGTAASQALVRTWDWHCSRRNARPRRATPICVPKRSMPIIPICATTWRRPISIWTNRGKRWRSWIRLIGGQLRCPLIDQPGHCLPPDLSSSRARSRCSSGRSNSIRAIRSPTAITASRSRNCSVGARPARCSSGRSRSIPTSSAPAGIWRCRSCCAATTRRAGSITRRAGKARPNCAASRAAASRSRYGRASRWQARRYSCGASRDLAMHCNSRAMCR